jgi:hypothetical protein
MGVKLWMKVLDLVRASRVFFAKSGVMPGLPASPMCGTVTFEPNVVSINRAPEKLLRRFQFLFKFAMIFGCMLLPSLSLGQVSVVQVNGNPFLFLNTDSVEVPFTVPQAAGNLNVVVVGWNDISNAIASVEDSNGNTYAVAAGTVSTPLPAPGAPQAGVSQSIYYAKNINSGANRVTVKFNQNTAMPSVRIVEYSGLDPLNPLDTAVGGSGTSIPADSAAVTTNSAHDLLIGAGSITTAFTGSGPGFTTELLDGFGDIVEDQLVTAAGSYSATATFASGDWVMQMAAFRQGGQTPPVFPAPVISSLSISSSPEAGGIPLTIAGTNFETGAAVAFSDADGITAAGVNCSVALLAAPQSTISCLTPSFPTGTASVTVTNVDGQISAPSALTFTVSTPFAAAVSPSITPDTGSTNGGTLVTISGSDFGAGAKVTVGEIPADRVLVENVNTIQADLPSNSEGLASVVVRNSSGIAGTLPGGYGYAPGNGVSFVQVNSAHPASPAATAPVDYPLSQTAGNMNVVIIGWDDVASTVTCVTDTAGNTYTLALNPTVGIGISQSIYYAKNIHASASNTVTVKFSAPARSPDVRVLEYSGLDTINPLDAGAGNFGTGTALDSGAITTSTTGDLVIGGSTLDGIVAITDPSFTAVAITPNGISVEHLIGVAASTLDATATQNFDGNWVIQAVAFKQAGIAQDFSLSVSPSGGAPVTTGNPATYSVSVSASGGFNSPVTLICSAGLPLGTSCAFAPSVVMPGAASALTVTPTAAAPLGTYTVTVKGSFESLNHETTVGLTIAAAPPNFTIAPTALSPASVAAGGSSTSTIVISPTEGFNNAVSLTCGVAPLVTNGPSCSFNPTSVAGGSGSSTLTISTTAATTAALVRSWRGALFAMWLPIAGLALLGASSASRNKTFCNFVLGSLVLSGLVFLSGCGGSSPMGGGSGHAGTPAGVYNITVTATSGSLTHMVAISLTVQ